MPRIPQAEFQTAPSTNVGSANIRQESNAGSNFTEAISNVTGALAKLQDQEERTQAYSAANDLKRKYHMEKVQYETALKSADSSGNYDYIDPLDNNPDISKRKRYSGNIADKFKEMKTFYDEGLNSIRGMPREDIANELIQQYVGDDLINTNIRTNQYMVKKKEKEVSDTALENMQIQFSGITQAVADGEAPEVVAGMARQINQRLRQEAVNLRPIVGDEAYSQIEKARDRYASTTATEMIRNGVNNSTVYAADQMIKNINNPLQRQLAQNNLERVKKTTVTVKNTALLNSALDVTQKISTQPTINDGDYLKVVEMAKNVKNMYVDESYGGVSRDQADQASERLMSTVLAKRMIQQNITTNLQFLSDPEAVISSTADTEVGMRNPSGVMESEQMKALKSNIAAEIEEAGISKVTGIDKDALLNQTILNMRSMYGDVRRNIADLVQQDSPDVTGRERLEKITYIAEQNGFGDVPLVSKEDVKIFKQDFMSNLAKDPRQALTSFNRNLENAGEAFQGEKSYRRALAIDLADKDPKLAFVIPMADADPDTQMRMITNAGKFEVALSEHKDKLSINKLVDQFNTLNISNLVNLKDSSMYDGLKQAMIQDAAVRVADSRGALSLKDAMKETEKFFNNQYSVVSSRDGRSSVLGLSRKGAVEYAGKEPYMGLGMEKITTLPDLPKAEKIRLLESNAATRGRFNENTPDDHINFILSRTLTVQPDSRWPNMNTVMMGNRRVTDSSGKVIRYSTDQVIKLGEEVNKNKDKSIRIGGR